MKPLLSVNNLTHLYAPGKGFSNVSFELWPGEVLGIVGESGSGKTTLLKSITARLAPPHGELRCQGRSLDGLSAAGRRRLRQIAKQCVNYGQRVQNSVFECLLNAAQCKQLQHKLCSIMDESVDSLRFYYLGDKYHTRSEHFGAKAGYDA